MQRHRMEPLLRQVSVPLASTHESWSAAKALASFSVNAPKRTNGMQNIRVSQLSTVRGMKQKSRGSLLDEAKASMFLLS